MSRLLTRRTAIGLGLGAIAARLSWAETVIDLDWADLVPPEDQDSAAATLRGLVSHSAGSKLSTPAQPARLRHDWNGQIVRLPGYMVPLEHKGSGVIAFLLVPYVGACVHVPPPPPNQLVFVTTQTPYENDGLFEPVNVTGMFGVSAQSTQLAEVGYALSADHIEPFG